MTDEEYYRQKLEELNMSDSKQKRKNDMFDVLSDSFTDYLIAKAKYEAFIGIMKDNLSRGIVPSNLLSKASEYSEAFTKMYMNFVDCLSDYIKGIK